MSYFDLCCVPGFAVSLQVILSSPKAVFKRRGSQPGMQESDFLKQITKVEELEPKADNCTKVKPPIVTSEFYFFIDTLFIIVYAFLHSVHSSKVDIGTIRNSSKSSVFFFSGKVLLFLGSMNISYNLTSFKRSISFNNASVLLVN